MRGMYPRYFIVVLVRLRYMKKIHIKSVLPVIRKGELLDVKSKLALGMRRSTDRCQSIRV